jgi:hypothetical protein
MAMAERSLQRKTLAALVLPQRNGVNFRARPEAAQRGVESA